ncbi:hypothetical protein CDG81_13245 [Actinopolyspora erythraea]|uniref:Uncharacterized protein n=1 Tax=Actinopolyspora erythraea TaxID=414996 RepID=A0A223RTB0_9ACTN|nr:hypothetical protein [Actinopolyspora erythraea]ASU79091.1 hypothetical protein CDG81_13245 [Actinopolyspora erythraea]
MQHGARRGEPGRPRADEGYGHQELRSALLTEQRLECPVWKASAIRLALGWPRWRSAERSHGAVRTGTSSRKWSALDTRQYATTRPVSTLGGSTGIVPVGS